MNALDVMIVAQSPGEWVGMPFDERAGTRLAELLQVGGIKELIKQCVIVNLLSHWPGQVQAFPHEAAQVAAKHLEAQRPIVIMCGRSVGAACGVNRNYFEPVVWRGGVAVVIPHPSSISRWWNDADNHIMAERFFEDILTKGEIALTWPRFSPDKFRSVMTLRGVTQKKVALGIKRDEHTVGRWARGETKPDVDDFFALTWWLNVDPTDLAE